MSYFIDCDEYIYLKPDSISHEVCDYLIHLFETAEIGAVNDGTVVGGFLPKIKKTRDMNLGPITNKFDNTLYNEISLNLDPYFKGNKCEKVMPLMKKVADSGYHVQKYESNVGYYNYHEDELFEYMENVVRRRVLTFIWYLNTVEEGGETEFFNGRIKIKPEKGKLLIFPSTWTYMHRGNMPISSDKYIVTGWISSDVHFIKDLKTN